MNNTHQNMPLTTHNSSGGTHAEFGQYTGKQNEMTFKTGKDLVNDARSRIQQVSAAEACAALARGEDISFLDVPEPNEWNLGHVPGAIHIPRGNLESKIESLLQRERRIFVYCAQGNRSALATETLLQMGYSNAVSVSDGWAGWVAADGEVAD
jgi:rhodanese-related sulfurtransferase